MIYDLAEGVGVVTEFPPLDVVACAPLDVADKDPVPVDGVAPVGVAGGGGGAMGATS